MRSVLTVLAVAVLTAAVPAQAQEKRWDLNLGAGYTAALSDVKEHLGNGYNVGLGVTFDVTPVVGLQVLPRVLQRLPRRRLHLAAGRLRRAHL